MRTPLCALHFARWEKPPCVTDQHSLPLSVVVVLRWISEVLAPSIAMQGAERREVFGPSREYVGVCGPRRWAVRLGVEC